MSSGRLPLMTALGAAAVAVALWGASPVGTKIALVQVSPLAVTAIRTTAGGLVGLALALLFRIELPLGWKDRAQVALAGFCGMVAFPTLFSFGIRSTSASHGAMILACMPVTTSAIAYAWSMKWPQRRWWIGCSIALVGEALLIFQRGGSEDSGTLGGDILVFASTLFACAGYVIGSNLQKRGYPARGITFWGAGISACLLLPWTPWLLADIDPIAWKASTWLSLAYLAFGVTILGYICWYWALGQGGVQRISLMQFFQARVGARAVRIPARRAHRAGGYLSFVPDTPGNGNRNQGTFAVIENRWWREAQSKFGSSLFGCFSHTRCTRSAQADLPGPETFGLLWLHVFANIRE